MQKDDIDKPKIARGRPPNLAARRAALRAAHELFEERGLPGVTMEAVAARSGVSKPTLYRHWPNAYAITMAALLEHAGGDQDAGAAPGAEPPPIDGLRRSLMRFITMFSTDKGRQMASMLAGMEMDSELAKVFRSHFLLKGRDDGVAILREAQAQGALPPHVDIEALGDMLYGAIFYRLLLGRRRIDGQFVDELIDLSRSILKQ